ncbi:MAG TPA: hypothetical protein VGV59_18060 [Pyrinomonadaceae bacterium]|nr:hypothetical protein [Pyrinomonadaceae bacterium]
MDAGEEPIADQSLVERLRAKARIINRRALVTAIGVTLVTVAFPGR